MSFTLTHLIPVMPELFILGMTCVILLLGLYLPKQRLTYWLSQLTLLVATILSIQLFSAPTILAFNEMFILDKAATLCKIFIYIMSAFAFLYARQYNHERVIAENEYYILGLFAVLGMMIMVSANNLLIIFLGIELLSLSLYAMAAMWRTSGQASEAAMKYFVMGALASGMLLYGLSMLYGATGSLAITQIAQNTINYQHNLIFAFGLVFITAGLAFKLGAAPFHLWAPDVYQGAPTSTVLFLSAAPKIAVFAIIFRILANALPNLYVEWQQLMIAVAVLSMALGNIIAIAQSSLKRMLAYSAIAHMGYMSLGIIAGTADGYSAALFYIASYALMSLGALGILILLSKQHIEIEHFNDLRGLNERNPWIAFMMLIIMFSMAGIPISVGFFAKLGVLQALVSQHIIWLAALALVFSIIGAYYYLRVVKMMYFDAAENSQAFVVSKDLQLTLTINGLLVLGLGMFPGGLIEICRSAFA